MVWILALPLWVCFFIGKCLEAQPSREEYEKTGESRHTETIGYSEAMASCCCPSWVDAIIGCDSGL